ncbi:peptidyl-prolyl cis-trans isomerase CYP65-like isoform X2 [Mangifera indica]|uniref:peptidyl-prolyl cis-trans isomerase CYP65-like isoform X2 n=1 Tax=Mangifera indica TaxID=29780 RepID=UPI001CFBE7C0|nr:peptidyl-prolyl cis-trans isomerase CYP65-like isoform X2 [Mangifera indica]
MFITRTEWVSEWGGTKRKEIRTPFKRLRFHFCALSLTPFEDPVCTADGTVFDMIFCRSCWWFDYIGSNGEGVPVDDNDQPQEIKITGVTVFVNPYSELDEEEEEKAKEEENAEDEDKVGSWYVRNLASWQVSFTNFESNPMNSSHSRTPVLF